MRQVLERLIAHGLYVKVEKSKFNVRSTKFLGHTVSPDGITMDNKQVQAILDFPAPTSPKEMFRFLGLCNTYRRYINGHALLTAPLTALLRKSYGCPSVTP